MYFELICNKLYSGLYNYISDFKFWNTKNCIMNFRMLNTNLYPRFYNSKMKIYISNLIIKYEI